VSSALREYRHLSDPGLCHDVLDGRAADGPSSAAAHFFSGFHRSNRLTAGSRRVTGVSISFMRDIVTLLPTAVNEVWRGPEC
jgi:hypothetical protein